MNVENECCDEVVKVWWAHLLLEELFDLVQDRVGPFDLVDYFSI